MGQATEQDKRPWKFQIEKHAKATSTTEPVMNTNLSLIIPDAVETEASLGVIQKAEILSSLWNRHNICRKNVTNN